MVDKAARGCDTVDYDKELPLYENHCLVVDVIQTT